MTNSIRYMLDTNTASYLIKGVENVCRKVSSLAMTDLGISAITEGELLFGLAKNSDAKHLNLLVHEFLIRVETLPWNSEAAKSYGALRANLQKQGKTLGNLDLLIAAHALSVNATLITNDKAFAQVKELKIENWT